MINNQTKRQRTSDHGYSNSGDFIDSDFDQNEILKQLSSQMNTVIQGMSGLSNGQSSLSVGLNSLSAEMSSGFKKINEQVEKVESMVNNHSLRLTTINKRLNDIEQDKRRNKVEIQGLLERKLHGNDLCKNVVNYLSKIGISVEKHELAGAFCYSKKVRNQDEVVVVAEFNHENTKSRIMSEKFKKKTDDSVYFSHSLTKYNAGLMSHAKKLKKNKKIVSYGLMGNKVYIIKSEGGPKQKIDDHNILDSLGNEIEMEVTPTDVISASNECNPGCSSQLMQSQSNSLSRAKSRVDCNEESGTDSE